jgi:hypothetical protein
LNPNEDDTVKLLLLMDAIAPHVRGIAGDRGTELGQVLHIGSNSRNVFSGSDDYVRSV